MMIRYILSLLVAFVAACSTPALASGIVSPAFVQAGTGAVPRGYVAKVREVAYSVTDFAGVDPTGVSDSTAGIQAAHDAAVTKGAAYGMAEVIFPAGKYKVTATLNWSPLVRMKATGNVVISSNVASGKGLYVSTRFGNWTVVGDRTAYNANVFQEGKLVLENSLGSGSNTATGIFFGDDGMATYSAESIVLRGIYVRGWSKAVRFGSHAYLIGFADCNFRDNGDAVFNDWTAGYLDRMERISFDNCIFAGNTNVLNGDNSASGEVTFSRSSFDYNSRVLAGFNNTMVLSFVGGCHFEFNSANPLFSVQGSSLVVSDYLAAYLGAGTGPNPLIATIGANGVMRSRGMAALTPTGATLFDVASSSGRLTADDSYKQNGGAATAYITNTGGGWVEQFFASNGAAGFVIGSAGNLKGRFLGAYTHEFTKSVAAGASVDIFDVGPIASYVSAVLMVQSTSDGLMTVKTYQVDMIGAGTPGGVVQLAAVNYSGGASTFTIAETANSPVAGKNKITLTNTSGAACVFTVSLFVNYISTGGAIDLL